MALAEQTLARVPSARGKLIVHSSYRRTRYMPERDRGKPVLDLYARSIAAYLLQVDDRQSVQEIAAELSCSEADVIAFVGHGAHMAHSCEEALALMATIRDDVYEGLEKVGMHMMLTEEKPPETPVTEPLPETVPKAISLVGRILDVNVGLITGPTRHAPETDARHIAMSLVQFIRPEFSRRQVGSFFGNRDHSTALNGIRRVDKAVRLVEDDPVLVRKAELVCGRLARETDIFHFIEKRR